MATDLIMPTLPGDQPHSRHILPERPPHSRSHSYQLPRGPQISPSSTPEHSQNQGTQSQNNSTPGSPRNSYHARQLRPLYMPAVLRPNEFPSRRGPGPKVKTPDGTGARTPDSSDSDYTLRRSSNSFISIGGLGALGQRLSSRRSTGESCKNIDGEWDLGLYPAVAGLPSRDHWKPDNESTVCDDPTCKRTFNYFNRRHHCRKCGHIFCDTHSSFVVPLDQDANFNPRAAPSRTCRHCFEVFRMWHGTNNSQVSSSNSSDVPHSMPATPIAAGPGANNMSNMLGQGLAQSPHEVAASVPRDWNWSTF